MTRSLSPQPLSWLVSGVESITALQRAAACAPLEACARAAQAGDGAATRQLLGRALPRARNLVRYLVRGDRDVDDIAQEALVALVRGIRTYRAEGPFEAWVDRVVVRATFSYLKRRRAEPQLTVLDSESLRAGTAPGTSAADQYAVRRRVVAVLDELAEEQRVVLVLHHVLEMSVPEIAAETGAPAETVRSRLRLARARLRAIAQAEAP